MNPTLYDILGIARNATTEEVRSAYRRLAQLHHPDKVTGNETIFKTINDAHSVLTDAGRRSAYDATLNYPTSPQANAEKASGAYAEFATPHGLSPADTKQKCFNILKGVALVGAGFAFSILADSYKAYEGWSVALLTICYIAAFCQFYYFRYVVSYKLLGISAVDTIKSLTRN